MIGLDDWPANPPPLRPILSDSQQIVARIEKVHAEINHQAAQLEAAEEAGNYGQARTAALCLRTASDVYITLCNKLQHTDQ